MPSWIDELNAPQRQAATFGDGPVLVIAGAGTGKTRTLACRVGHLVDRGVPPDRIMLLTFTRRAAAQMIARAGQCCGPAQAARVWGGTFHATANRLLRQYGQNIGLAPEFTVIDQSDAADVVNLIRGELGLAQSKGRKRFPRKTTLIAIYSRMVNSRTKLSELLELHYPWCAEAADGIRGVFERYTERKREQNVLDYDDLLLYWHALLSAEGLGDAVADRFDHILVDEYQDTNLVQAEVLRAMRRRNRNIMVVGDDAQSIYSFRAATVRNILDFPKQFEGTTVIKLEQNYRSVQPILDASNAVMSQAGERYTKQLFSRRPSDARPQILTCMDEAEQCTAVADRILEKREEGVILKQQAVLFRAAHHSDQLEVELTRRNIPFVKYGGLKFVESAHIKDMIAILRLLENPNDQLSWYRVLQLIEGIGPATAQRLIGLLMPRAEPGPEAASGSPLHRLATAPPAVPPAATREFASFCRCIADCVEMGKAHPASQVERIRRFYEPIFERHYDNPTIRLRDLDQLEQLASGYRTRNAFITDLTLDPPTTTQDLAGPPLLDEDWITLSTIHSAKGMEWDVVHIIHAADGMMPSDMATGSAEEIDEERRLLYVAMTRARDTLTLYFPLRYYFRPKGRGDKHSYAQLTRFIPESICDRFDRRTAHGVETDGPVIVHTPTDARAQITGMLGDLMA